MFPHERDRVLCVIFFPFDRFFLKIFIQFSLFQRQEIHRRILLNVGFQCICAYADGRPLAEPTKRRRHTSGSKQKIDSTYILFIRQMAHKFPSAHGEHRRDIAGGRRRVVSDIALFVSHARRERGNWEPIRICPGNHKLKKRVLGRGSQRTKAKDKKWSFVH